MNNMNVDEINVLVKLAYDFGPYLFALLFLLWLSVWSQRNYHKAVTRLEPPASNSEVQLYKIILYGTLLSGVVLVAICVYSWVIKQNQLYAFKGKITALDEYTELTSESLYFKPELIQKLNHNEIQLRSECFLINSNEKFNKNTRFTIYYSKGGGQTKKFFIPYTTEENPSYQIRFNEKKGENEIFQLEGANMSIFPKFVRSAYADSISIYPYLVVNNTGQDFKKSDLYYDMLVDVLQTERSSVGSKIIAMDKILSFNPNEINTILNRETKKEHMLSTIIDLTRHTDNELAYKARSVFDEKFDINLFITEKVNSEYDHEKLKSYFDIFSKVETGRLYSLLSLINKPYLQDRLQHLLTKTSNNDDKRLLIPTGSEKGDRYYVKAIQLHNSSECLTQLYQSWYHGNDETPADATKISTNSTQEYMLFYYSKKLVNYAANEIGKCGGEYFFTSGYTSRPSAPTNLRIISQ